MQDEPDYYKILQIEPTATAEQLREQHRKLVRELHPDRHGGDPRYAERLTQVNSAFHELKNELRRSAYDRRRREAAMKAATLGRGASAGQTKPKPRQASRASPLRPINSRFTTKSSLYSMHPAAKKTRKRNALIGALVTSILALSLVAMSFSLFSSGVQTSLLDLYYCGVNLFTPHSKQEEIAQVRAQYEAIEAQYVRRISAVQEEADTTIAASTADAASLQYVGDASDAKTLRHDATAFQDAINSVYNQIKTLHETRQFTDESKLESDINLSLDNLDLADRELSTESQDLRRNSTDVDSPPDPSMMNGLPAATVPIPAGSPVDNGETPLSSNSPSPTVVQ